MNYFNCLPKTLFLNVTLYSISCFRGLLTQQSIHCHKICPIFFSVMMNWRIQQDTVLFPSLMGKREKRKVEQLFIVVLNFQSRWGELLLPPGLGPEAGLRLLGQWHGAGVQTPRGPAPGPGEWPLTLWCWLLVICIQMDLGANVSQTILTSDLGPPGEDLSLVSRQYHGECACNVAQGFTLKANGLYFPCIFSFVQKHIKFSRTRKTNNNFRKRISIFTTCCLCPHRKIFVTFYIKRLYVFTMFKVILPWLIWNNSRKGLDAI